MRRFFMAVALAAIASPAIADNYTPPSANVAPLMPIQGGVNQWYPIVQGALVAGQPTLSGTTMCGIVQFPASVTVDQLTVIVGTVETGVGGHFGFYSAAWDATAHIWYPSGAPVATDNTSGGSAGISLATAGAVNVPLAASYSFQANTPYYFCVQTAAFTAKFTALNGSTGIVSSTQYYSGSTTVGNVIPAAGNKLNLYFTSGAYGTWPNTAGSTGWSWYANAVAPFFAYRVVSSP